MQAPAGLFDYLAVVSGFFLIFPFFYTIHRDIVRLLLKKLQDIYVKKIDSFISNNTDFLEREEVKIGEASNLMNPLLQGIKNQLYKKTVPNSLAIGSLLMFVSTQSYMYYVMYVEQYSWLNSYITEHGFIKLPFLLNLSIGAIISIFLYIKIRENIAEIIKTINTNTNKSNGISDKIVFFLYEGLLVVVWVALCALCIVVLYCYPSFYPFFMFSGLFIVFFVFLLTYLWYWVYIYISLDNIANTDNKKTNAADK